MKCSPLRKHSFAAVTDKQTHTLILGSLPGELSLTQNQYYAHPQNRFWKLLSAVIDADLTVLPYSNKLETLLAYGIGLWDVIAEAHRSGSLDSQIRDHLHNDLLPLIATLPQLHTIAFNGNTAAKIGYKLLNKQINRYRFITLPSSSPAYTRPYNEKLAIWLSLKSPFLIE